MKLKKPIALIEVKTYIKCPIKCGKFCYNDNNELVLHTNSREYY